MRRARHDARRDINANGNLTRRGQTGAFEYDQTNRLTAVKHPTTGAVRANYAYDGMGNRASTSAGGVGASGSVALEAGMASITRLEGGS